MEVIRLMQRRKLKYELLSRSRCGIYYASEVLHCTATWYGALEGRFRHLVVLVRPARRTAVRTAFRTKYLLLKRCIDRDNRWSFCSHDAQSKRACLDPACSPRFGASRNGMNHALKRSHERDRPPTIESLVRSTAVHLSLFGVVYSRNPPEVPRAVQGPHTVTRLYCMVNG